MKPSIVSFNSHNINDGTNYTANFADQAFFPQATSQSVELMRSDNSPVISQVKRNSKVVKVNIYPVGTFTTQINQLHGWFDTYDKNLHKFIVSDESSVQWFVNARVEGEPHAYADYVQIQLRVPDPIWQQVNSTTNNWSITATGQTNTITLTGNRSVFPIFSITPTSAKTGGFGYTEYRVWYNPQTTVALKDEILDVANHAWNTSTIVGAGHALASGNDFRLKVQGQGGAVDWPFWLDGWNGTTTKVFTVIDFDPGITLTLSGSINNSVAVTSLSFKKTTANLAALKSLATKKNFVLVIGSEVFNFNSGTTIDLVNYKITTTATDARAAFGSTKAAHSDGDSIYWIQYVFQFCYGNSSLSAPTQDDSKKPIINLTSSLNTSWVYDTNFSDITGLRAGSWKPLVNASPGKQSQYYTGKHTLGSDTAPTPSLADPSTCMGGWISAYQQGTTWRGELANISWTFYNGAGVTTFTAVTALYRYSTDFPKTIALQYSKDGKVFTSATGFPESSPASAQTWTAGATHSSVALGATYAYLKFLISGSIASNITSDVAAGEITSITLTRDSAKIPQLAYTSASIGAYQLQCTLTNNGTTDNLAIDFTLGLNETLVVDCLNQKITYNGANVIGCMTTNTKRNYWLTIEPPTTNGGVTNGGVFQFDDTGTNAVTLSTAYQDRLA